MKSFYDILEVSSGASAAEIRASYLRLAREYHPDRVPEHLTKLRADAEEKTKELNEAWAVLGNAAARTKYDSKLRHQPQPRTYRPSSAATPGARQTSWGAVLAWLRSRKEAVRWGLALVVMTLVLVVIGEIVVSHGRTSQPDASAGKFSDTLQNSEPQRVVRYDSKPLQFRGQHLAGGSDLSVQLLSVSLSESKTVLTFRATAGAHSSFLLYEPPGGSSREKNVLGKRVVADRGLEEIYLVDGNGTKYYSTSGFLGGEQVKFDLYNFTRRINLAPHTGVLLRAEFPPTQNAASSVTFVSPGLAKWQPEWRWPSINVK